MHVTHRILLSPSEEASAYFRRCCGARRFAYNWGLARWNELYGLKKSGQDVGQINHRRIRDDLVAAKRAGDVPWLYEITKHAVGSAFDDLGAAFKRFFCRKGKYPVFKKKGRSRESFRVMKEGGRTFAVEGRRLRLPKIGWVKMAEELRFRGELRQVTVSERAGKWYASILVDTGGENPYRQCRNPEARVGVDLGVNVLATLSAGAVKKFKNPRSLQRILPKIRRVQRQLARRTMGGRNYSRAKLKLARLYARAADVRNDAIHKLTAYLTASFGHVVIEDLNVSGMLRGNAARSIMDAAFGEFRRQLEYKGPQRGCQIWLADRFFPSSKTCRDCGRINQGLGRGQREWSCDGCGVVHDRDANAAGNLEDLLFAA